MCPGSSRSRYGPPSASRHLAAVRRAPLRPTSRPHAFAHSKRSSRVCAATLVFHNATHAYYNWTRQACDVSAHPLAFTQNGIDLNGDACETCAPILYPCPHSCPGVPSCPDVALMLRVVAESTTTRPQRACPQTRHGLCARLCAARLPRRATASRRSATTRRRLLRPHRAIRRRRLRHPPPSTRATDSAWPSSLGGWLLSPACASAWRSDINSLRRVSARRRA